MSHRPIQKIYCNYVNNARLFWLLTSKESTFQRRRPKFDPWVGKIPWRRKWQPTPVLLPEKTPWQRSLVGSQATGLQRVRHDLVTKPTTGQQSRLNTDLTWFNPFFPTSIQAWYQGEAKKKKCLKKNAKRNKTSRPGSNGYNITLPPFIPVATAVTNLDPKCPSGDSRHMLGCLFWKSPAVIHSSELRK